MEIDIVAESKCGRVVLVEVKKTPAKTGLNTVEDFQEKVEAYRRLFPEKTILPGIYQGSETLLWRARYRNSRADWTLLGKYKDEYFDDGDKRMGEEFPSTHLNGNLNDFCIIT